MLDHSKIESRAMLLHRCKITGAIDLTVHRIIHHKEKPESTIGEGRVLGAEEKAEIVNILNDDTSTSFTLQSDKVLAKTPYALAWWTPKAKREILFQEEGNYVRHTVTFPSMVGIYMRGQLHFAVTKGGAKTRPTNDTPLFYIPLPNLYEDGTFCRGNANLPAQANESNIPAWENFVFDTLNTHLGTTMPLHGIESRKALISAYASAELTGRFPTGQLRSMDTTLSSWMKNLDERRL